MPESADKRKKRNKKPRTALKGRLEFYENEYNNSSVDSSSAFDGINFKYERKINTIELTPEIARKKGRHPKAGTKKKGLSQILYNLWRQ